MPNIEKDASVDAIKFKDKDLKFILELGAGSGGSVSKVLHIPTNSIMARKVSILSILLPHFFIQIFSMKTFLSLQL
jgi:hypothetical protein